MANILDKLENNNFKIVLVLYVFFLAATYFTFVVFTIILIAYFSSNTGCLILDYLNVFDSITSRGYTICYKIKEENYFSFIMIEIIMMCLLVSSYTQFIYWNSYFRYVAEKNLITVKKIKKTVTFLVLLGFFFHFFLIVSGLFFLNNVKTKTTIDVFLCAATSNSQEIGYSPPLKWSHGRKYHSKDKSINKFKLIDKYSFLNFVDSTSVNDCGKIKEPIKLTKIIGYYETFSMYNNLVITSFLISFSMFMISLTKNSRKKFLMNRLIKHDKTIVDSNKEMFNNFVFNNFNQDEIFVLRFMEVVTGDGDLINKLWDIYKNNHQVDSIGNPSRGIYDLNSRVETLGIKDIKDLNE